MQRKKILKIPVHQKLSGEINISGSKNAALPILVATLLCDEEIILKNIPNLTDIHIILELLNDLGSKTSFNTKTNTVIIHKKNINEINPLNINHEKASKIRASSLFMGPLLSRKGISCIFHEGGGCKIGKRSLDLHIKFLKMLGGYEVHEENCCYLKNKKKKLKGNSSGNIDFKHRISVGATQNLILAAVLAEGITKIKNAALEPEIVNLCDFLRCMGAQISGDGTSQIIINGIEKLHGCYFYVMSDRIETGSYIVAALMNRAEIIINNSASQKDLSYFIEILKKTNAEISFIDNGKILVKERTKKPKAVSIETAPYPLFPTDLAQIYSTYMTISDGSCLVKENLFENRFSFSSELNKKMSSNIENFNRSNNIIKINGVKTLNSNNNNIENPLSCYDLRGGMSLLCSSLTSKEDLESKNENIFIDNFDYIKRGYEDFIKKFSSLGVNIKEI